jgi:hypothetical protein
MDPVSNLQGSRPAELARIPRDKGPNGT